MKNIAKRAGWFMLALLFVVTGLGVGVYAFWQATHPPKDNTNTVSTSTACPQPAKNARKLENFTPVSSVSSIKTTDIKVGTGKVVQSGSTITANYTGALACNGVIFQSSLDAGGKPFTAALNQVIPGWTIGIPGMKAGGQRRLLIPAQLAYGANPPQGSGIPANADLVFDVWVLDVK